jgi:hypothetical protein
VFGGETASKGSSAEEDLVETQMRPKDLTGVEEQVHWVVWGSRPSKGLVAIEASQPVEYLQDYDDK